MAVCVIPRSGFLRIGVNYRAFEGCLPKSTAEGTHAAHSSNPSTPARGLVTVKELAIASMWEHTAVVELLERIGILTKQEILDMIEDHGAGTPTRPCESAAHGTWPTIRR